MPRGIPVAKKLDEFRVKQTEAVLKAPMLTLK
jgi:hypothetical protein